MIKLWAFTSQNRSSTWVTLAVGDTEEKASATLEDFPDTETWGEEVEIPEGHALIKVHAGPPARELGMP